MVAMIQGCIIFSSQLSCAQFFFHLCTSNSDPPEKFLISEKIELIDLWGLIIFVNMYCRSFYYSFLPIISYLIDSCIYVQISKLQAQGALI